MNSLPHGDVCEFFFGGGSSRERSLSLLSDNNERLPLCMSMTHPRISLIVSQYPPPVSAFLRLAESLVSLGMDGKIYLRVWSVRSETLCCWTESP